MSQFVRDAAAYAAEAHKNQKRKYTGAPYIEHPEAVACLVSSVPHTDQMLAAAWLHDVMEDCGVTREQIFRNFGPEVADLVEWLTDVSKPSDGGRAARKALDRAHTAKAPPHVKTVKLADIIDNAHSIMLHDPIWAVTYLKEKRQLLPFLKEGDPRLWADANKIVEDALLDKWELYVPPAPQLCDLCPKKAVWKHYKGGFRCGNCPRPKA